MSRMRIGIATYDLFKEVPFSEEFPLTILVRNFHWPSWKDHPQWDDWGTSIACRLRSTFPAVRRPWFQRQLIQCGNHSVTPNLSFLWILDWPQSFEDENLQMFRETSTKTSATQKIIIGVSSLKQLGSTLFVKTAWTHLKVRQKFWIKLVFSTCRHLWWELWIYVFFFFGGGGGRAVAFIFYPGK